MQTITVQTRVTGGCLGNRDSIYNYAFNELRVDKFDTIPIDPDFVHTTRFVLIDKNFNIRGYYDGTDSSSLDKLSKDIGLLMLSVDDNPEQLSFDPVLLIIYQQHQQADVFG